jgi:hypothetical protein
MNKFILLIAFIISSCGPYQVNVTHKFEIDLGKLETYFEKKCEEEQSNNIKECTENKIDDFINSML